jgi:hypothetical protein
VGVNNARVESIETAIEPEHEVLAVFARHGLALNSTLHEMLGEHYSHRTERRGAGFTQATRHLAGFVNRPRPALRMSELRLFRARLSQPPPNAVLQALPDELTREESRTLTRMMVDLIHPVEAREGVTELPAWPDDLKIGTCSLAEKYFLELAAAFVRGKGLANVLISESGEPLMLEKRNLGDDHSCISVTPLLLNGVVLPPGSLLGVRYDEPVALRKNRSLPGQVIPVGACSGFRFLRLSTLAVSPPHRARAFTAHFQAQLDAGLFSPGEATVEQIRRLAASQL